MFCFETRRVQSLGLLEATTKCVLASTRCISLEMHAAAAVNSHLGDFDGRWYGKYDFGDFHFDVS